MRRCLASLIFLGLAIATSVPSWADDDILYAKRPEWELGVNVGEFFLADYPGSSQYHLQTLPLPYVVYRGEFLKSDQTGGVRGTLIDSSIFDFDISADTAFPVDSTHNAARAGMPNLDWMFEIGPRALFHVFKFPTMKLDFGAAVRAVYSINTQELWSQGFDFYPSLKYYYRVPTKKPSYLNCVWGGIWATYKLMSYLYGIDAQYATAVRPEYEARPGFLGHSLSATYVVPLTERWSVYAGASKNFYSGASNINSPLFETKESEAYYIGFFWGTFKSVKEVVVADEF